MQKKRKKVKIVLLTYVTRVKNSRMHDRQVL